MLRFVIAIVLLGAVCQASANTTTVAMAPSPTHTTQTNATAAPTTLMSSTTTDIPKTTSGAPIVFAPTVFLLAVSTVFAAVLRI